MPRDECGDRGRRLKCHHRDDYYDKQSSKSGLLRDRFSEGKISGALLATALYADRRTLLAMKTLYSALLTSTALFTGLTCPVADAGNTVYRLADGIVHPSSSLGAVEAYLPMVAPFNHAANLLALPNGDLLCVWYTGTGERDRNVSIALSRLDHKSTRWSQPIIVAHRDNWANQNPVLFRTPDGKILLFYDSQQHGSSEATAVVNELISEDQGHTWSQPTTLFTHPGIYLRQPIVIFHDDWLFPVYQERSGGVSSSSAGKDSSLVEVSKDSGKTWSGIEVPESGGLVQMSIVLPTGMANCLPSSAAVTPTGFMRPNP